MLRDPQLVRLETPAARFDDTMRDIDAWLTREGIAVGEFNVIPTEDGYRCEIGFRSDAEAERFRRQFMVEAVR